MSKPWYRRRWFTIPLAIVVILLVLIGPWPADNTPYRQTDYYAWTLKNAEAPKSATGPVRAGFAAIDITTPVGHQLAGFTARSPYASDSIFSHCYARAMTLAVGDVQVTVLTADILLIDAEVAGRILAKTGLKPGDIFFTASHTHSGPGQWARHPVERIVIGSFDQAYQDKLVDQFAEVVMKSRAGLVPVDTAVVTVDAPGNQRNRISRERPTFDQLSAVLFRPAGEPAAAPLGALVSFGAHPTLIGPLSHSMSADYPGALVDRFKALTGVENVMFAAGAVGDASPVRLKAPTEQERAVLLGDRLADVLAGPVEAAEYRSQVTLSNAYMTAELPAVRVPVGADWRFSPLLTSWIGPKQSHLQALRIGPAVLVGFPGDYDGQLATLLSSHMAEAGLTMIPTSFNGDYLGYLISSDDFFNAPNYESRTMNFYGPWLGPYLNELAERLADSTAG